MISLTCTNCRTDLSIDDAFAGGVCRCQHCGTIQTVPSKRAGATAAGMAVKSKALYQKRARDVTTGTGGTGLDELAEVVTSSGLGHSSGLGRSTRPAGSGPVPAQRSNLTMLLGVAAIIVIALLLVILVVVTRRPTSVAQQSPAPVGGGSRAGVAPVATNPTFCGVPLDHPSVIYVLDRGSSTQTPFGSLKGATFNSIASLGDQRRFQVIFWDNSEDVAAFPAIMTHARPQNVEDVRRQMDEVFAFGATNAEPALVKAIAQRPAAIVIATGKAADLDESFVQMVNNVRKDVPVVIHTFAIGSVGQSTALQTVAASTSGQFRELSEEELSKFGG